MLILTFLLLLPSVTVTAETESSWIRESVNYLVDDIFGTFSKPDKKVKESPQVRYINLNIPKDDAIIPPEDFPLGSMSPGDVERAADYANYFHANAKIGHQKTMMMDEHLMSSYHKAIMSNKFLFEGKVVLDVGCGTGILAMWAAQAGASKVYAVEFTDMAKNARLLIENNRLSDIVEVVQSTTEDLHLPMKVDIILSEWMGFFLLRESMLDSLLFVRDRWLKPDGMMFPSHATMYLAPISDELNRIPRTEDLFDTLESWDQFSNHTRRKYNISMSALNEQYEVEVAGEMLYSSMWASLHEEQVVGKPNIIKKLNLNNCTSGDAEGIKHSPFEMLIMDATNVSGFAGWFTVEFLGNDLQPTTSPVTLTTAPGKGYTHWGQQVFYLLEPFECLTPTRIQGQVSMERQLANQRMYDFHLSVKTDNEDIHYSYQIP